MKKTLLDIAKETEIKNSIYIECTKEHFDLILAFINKEIQYKQFSAAIGKDPRNAAQSAFSIIANGLRQGVIEMKFVPKN